MPKKDEEALLKLVPYTSEELEKLYRATQDMVMLIVALKKYDADWAKAEWLRIGKEKAIEYLQTNSTKPLNFKEGRGRRMNIRDEDWGDLKFIFAYCDAALNIRTLKQRRALIKEALEKKGITRKEKEHLFRRIMGKAIKHWEILEATLKRYEKQKGSVDPETFSESA